MVALTGGLIEGRVEGQVLPAWTSCFLPAGSVLRLGGMRHGCRSYLAVRGGFDCASVLGSRSTDLHAGVGPLGDDAALLAIVSSANIACGFHGGDPDIMRGTVALAVQHEVAIGAHVSLPDLQGFGRREMAVTPNEAYAMTLYQIGALQAFAQAAGTRLRHVKPHGALYNMAARDAKLAAAIARAVRDFDPPLRLFGLANSALIDAGIAPASRWRPRRLPIVAIAPMARCNHDANRTR